jgi:thiol:disulfide interchange protein DsbA
MMKRRDFSIAAAAGLLATRLQAQGGTPVAGTDFRALDKRAPVDAGPGKIEVVEFFGYWCPHCNVFEPTLQDWVKRLPKDVSFRRVPVKFRSAEEELLQRLYFALEEMGLVDKLHSKVFHAIHEEKQRFASLPDIENWAVKQGVDKTKFAQAMNSFSAATKLTKANQLVSAYLVDGVPALGVAGRFYAEGGAAGGMPRVLQVVDYLVAQVRSGH